MKRLLPILILFTIFLTGCSFSQEEYNKAIEAAYEAGYNSCLEKASVAEFDEIRHGELMGYINDHFWKEVVDTRLETDPNEFSDYVDAKKTVNMDEVTFIANKDSQIYHKKECSHVESISEDNILYWCDTEDKLVQAGFKPCSDCTNPTPSKIGYELKDVDFIDTPDSTAFKQIGYNTKESDIVVQFKKSGDYYVYYDVPKEVWDALVDADSKGGYYNKEIKGNYECEKLDLN